MPQATVTAFLAAEGVLYSAFLALDLLGTSSTGVWLKYIAVLLCLTFSLFSGRQGGDILIFLILSLTTAADLFLLVMGRGYEVGVVLFLSAQTLCFIRLRRYGAPPAWGVRSALVLLAGAVLSAMGLVSPLNLLVCLYFSCLAANALLALTLPGQRLFTGGLALFICCDLCVGLSNTPVLFPALTGFARVGMWLFYLPAQVLIALSGIPKDERSLL